MNKKLFLVLIVLMCLSLLGIIFVQLYWIKNAYNTKENQLSINVKNALIETSRKIQEEELTYYYSIYKDIITTSESPEVVSESELIYQIKKNKGEDIYIYSDGIIEEDFKLSSGFFDVEVDTFNFKKITNRKVEKRITTGLDKTTPTITKTESLERLAEYERKQFEKAFSRIAAQSPIHNRIDIADLQEILTQELRDRGIPAKFEYAVYSGDIATKVRSDDFQLSPKTTYRIDLFTYDDFQSKYQLYLNLYSQERTLLNEVLGMALLSLIFTSVIIFAFYSAVRQIFEQRQISQIKSDFINNMTHEFKTPIATINLALDALKNPKVKDNKEFLARYLGMIRDENKRMHAQVENVLRISKLEKNELDLQKERIKLHDVIEDAITHVELLVEDRQGYIHTQLDAPKSSILANESHITNVIVNILDNAIKYSEEAPKIDISTELAQNSILVKIKDQGAGMTKAVQKRIFEKFYREHTGDIHNVKGHGLGLAYVKQILDDHDATIYVESEKNAGSTFIIKFHLIS